MNIADAYEMADAIRATPKHWMPKNPSGPNADDAFIMYSCYVQRLTQLGINRPAP